MGPDYFIEAGDVSAYTTYVDNGVLAGGWTDLGDHYIGFAVLSGSSEVGWM